MRGWARALDLGATLTEYNDFKDAEEGDAEALYSDWELVGADINEGMGLWKLGNNAE
jgi:hypothetical protein